MHQFGQVVVVVDRADDEERARVSVPPLLAQLVQSLQHQGVGKVSHRHAGILVQRWCWFKGTQRGVVKGCDTAFAGERKRPRKVPSMS